MCCGSKREISYGCNLIEGRKIIYNRSGGGNSGYMIRQPKRYITCLMQHSLDVNGVIESSCCIFGEMLWCTL